MRRHRGRRGTEAAAAAEAAAEALACSAISASACQRFSPSIGDELYVCVISRTSRANGSLRISSSVDRWYFRISRSATVPGLRERCRRRRREPLAGLWRAHLKRCGFRDGASPLPAALPAGHSSAYKRSATDSGGTHQCAFGSRRAHLPQAVSSDLIAVQTHPRGECAAASGPVGACQGSCLLVAVSPTRAAISAAGTDCQRLRTVVRNQRISK